MVVDDFEGVRTEGLTLGVKCQFPRDIFILPLI